MANNIRSVGAAMLVLAVALAWAIGGRVQLLSPGPAPSPPLALRIAAAADLRFAMDELSAAYRQAHPTVVPTVTYGSSGTLYAQIVNGAPFDLFMSADVEYPRQLGLQGRTVPGSEFTYAIGRLVVWVPRASPFDVEKDGLDVVVDPRVRHVSIANPEHAPYGRTAEAAMREANVYDRANPKLVLAENVAQALQLVQSGAADVGIVAFSLAVSPTVRGTGRYWIVPERLHPRLEQGGAVLRTGAVEEAGAFRTYLLGDAARAVFKRYGFDRSGD